MRRWLHVIMAMAALIVAPGKAAHADGWELLDQSFVPYSQPYNVQIAYSQYDPQSPPSAAFGEMIGAAEREGDISTGDIWFNGDFVADFEWTETADPGVFWLNSLVTYTAMASSDYYNASAWAFSYRDGGGGAYATSDWDGQTDADNEIVFAGDNSFDERYMLGAVTGLTAFGGTIGGGNPGYMWAAASLTLSVSMYPENGT